MNNVRVRPLRPIPNADPKIRRLPVREPTVHHRPVFIAGVLIGVGLGALGESILFQHILQWHAWASGPLPVNGVPPEIAAENLRANLFWGGVVQLLAWGATAAGITVLWVAGTMRGVAWATRTLVGSLLIGCGAFALTEGLLAHHLLGLHHFRDVGSGAAWWDLAYLLLGAALAYVGWTIARPRTAGREPGRSG